MSSNTKLKITKKNLRQMFWRSYTTSHAWHYARQQNMSFEYSAIPFIKTLYANNKEERIKAYQRHLKFYNCAVMFHPLILGVTSGMEEARANALANGKDFNTDSIDSMKVALMGPLAGIGDSVIVGALRILATGLVAALCTQGNILGPILFFLIYNIPKLALRIWGIWDGYKYGSDIFSSNNTAKINQITSDMSTLGLMVIGAMSATLINVTTPIKFNAGKEVEVLQKMLDGIFPKLLPIAVLGICFLLLRKKVNVIVLLIGILIVGIFLGYFGILA
ncbi:PTS system mannose/fructose/sorbose family transporter subunit IID [Lactobacillus amylovorus]|uniref:PTS system mannose/fructose/sorbose family transporter subunit IID n=1 Tax=Lactobacillus amylovorus TaxID=1604 RepID=UPI0021A2CA76|nr:PTS system mannose/fructose/sorbose family transporter subunit IID [Lactobacillus amylovorus]MCT3586042.1 PTS system mannose/fructose/sorbose family transporter subunit IID [Lactobacillus amylovorus]